MITNRTEVRADGLVKVFIERCLTEDLDETMLEFTATDENGDVAFMLTLVADRIEIEHYDERAQLEVDTGEQDGQE